jgi:RimJ/RimL family protein N-acetyltransferase
MGSAIITELLLPPNVIAPYTRAMSTNMWEGEHIRLRGVRVEDWEHFLAWDADSDAQRYGWQAWPPKGAEAAKAFAKEASEKKIEGGGSNLFLVIESIDRVPAGSISVRPDDRRRSFEYGISLGREHWGKGYAEEAITLVCRYMFSELGYNKVQAFVYGFNERSISMHRKLGMRLEGTLTEAQFSAGRFWDCHIFGMTAREFFGKHGQGWGELRP